MSFWATSTSDGSQSRFDSYSSPSNSYNDNVESASAHVCYDEPQFNSTSRSSAPRARILLEQDVLRPGDWLQGVVEVLAAKEWKCQGVVLQAFGCEIYSEQVGKPGTKGAYKPKTRKHVFLEMHEAIKEQMVMPAGCSRLHFRMRLPVDLPTPAPVALMSYCEASFWRHPIWCLAGSPVYMLKAHVSVKGLMCDATVHRSFRVVSDDAPDKLPQHPASPDLMPGLHTRKNPELVSIDKTHYQLGETVALVIDLPPGKKAPKIKACIVQAVVRPSSKGGYKVSHWSSVGTVYKATSKQLEAMNQSTGAGGKQLHVPLPLGAAPDAMQVQSAGASLWYRGICRRNYKNFKLPGAALNACWQDYECGVFKLMHYVRVEIDSSTTDVPFVVRPPPHPRPMRRQLPPLAGGAAHDLGAVEVADAQLVRKMCKPGDPLGTAVAVAGLAGSAFKDALVDGFVDLLSNFA